MKGELLIGDIRIPIARASYSDELDRRGWYRAGRADFALDARPEDWGALHQATELVVSHEDGESDLLRVNGHSTPFWSQDGYEISFSVVRIYWSNERKTLQTPAAIDRHERRQAR